MHSTHSTSTIRHLSRFRNIFLPTSLCLGFTSCFVSMLFTNATLHEVLIVRLKIKEFYLVLCRCWRETRFYYCATWQTETNQMNIGIIMKRIRWTSGSSWSVLSLNWINSRRMPFHCTQSCSWRSSSVRAYDITVWRCFWLPRFKWPPQILQWKVNSFLWWSIIIMVYNKLIYEINRRWQDFTLVQHGKQKRIGWTSGSSWSVLSLNWINSRRTSFHCMQSCSWRSSSVRAYDITVWRCFLTTSVKMATTNSAMEG